VEEQMTLGNRLMSVNWPLATDDASAAAAAEQEQEQRGL